MIYIIILLALFGLYLLEQTSINLQSKNKNRNNKIQINSFFYYLFCILLIIVVSLRFDVGWDYMQYFSTIKYNLVTNIVDNEEFLTIYLIEFAREYGFYTYFLINAIITYTLIFITINKYSKSRWLSIFIFVTFPLFFLNSLSVIRIFTAIAIIFWSIQFIIKRNIFKYFLTIIIASLFHKSALIAILFYFIARVKLSTSRIIFLIICSPFIGYILTSIILNYFPRYTVYTLDSSSQEGTKAIFLLILVLILLILLRKKISKKLTQNIATWDSMFNIYLFSVLIYLVFLEQGTLGHRLSLYGTIFSVILIPYLFEIINNKNLRFILLVITLLIFSAAYFYIILVGSETYLPYEFIFNISV